MAKSRDDDPDLLPTACQCPGGHRMPGHCPGPARCPMVYTPTARELEEFDPYEKEGWDPFANTAPRDGE